MWPCIFTKGSVEASDGLDAAPGLAHARAGRARDRLASLGARGESRLVGHVGRGGNGNCRATGFPRGRAAGDLRRGRRAVWRHSRLWPWRGGYGAICQASRAQGHQVQARPWNLRSPLAWSMEIVAFASSLFAVFVVLAAGTNAAALGSWGTTVGVGVILGAALLCVLLVPRWHGEWLVYLAQTVVLPGLRRLPAGLSAIDRV